MVKCGREDTRADLLRWYFDPTEFGVVPVEQAPRQVSQIGPVVTAVVDRDRECSTELGDGLTVSIFCGEGKDLAKQTPIAMGGRIGDGL